MPLAQIRAESGPMPLAGDNRVSREPREIWQIWRVVGLMSILHKRSPNDERSRKLGP